MFDPDYTSEDTYPLENQKSEYLHGDEYEAFLPPFEPAQPNPTINADPNDAILIIAENFYLLRNGLPDADNRYLWDLANDIINKEDSVEDIIHDLVAIGDYPIIHENDEVGAELDINFTTAIRYCCLRSTIPDADFSYVWNTCKDNKNTSDEVFGKLVIHLKTSGDYPSALLSELAPTERAELKKRQLITNAQNILGHIDSAYIEEQLTTDQGMGYNEEGVSQLVVDVLNDSAKCPSKAEEYYRKIRYEAMQQYSNDFDVEKFLSRFPNPYDYFENKRDLGGPKYSADCYKYLRAVSHSSLPDEEVRDILKRHGTLIASHRYLHGFSVPIETVRYQLTTECARFINELTYIRFYNDITETEVIYRSVHHSIENNNNNMEIWKEQGNKVNCELCEDPVRLEKVLTCSEAHMFCEECVGSWVRQRVKDGYTSVNCLQNCEGVIHDKTVSKILSPMDMSNFVRRRQDRDVGEASIDGLINCFWCGFSYVPRTEDVDMVCLNPECGERWCSKCRAGAHFPEPCEDTPEEVMKRTYIEERMTQALGRTCPGCGYRIIKIDGCDYVTCSNCRSSLCYNCGQRGHPGHHCSGPRVDMLLRVSQEGLRAREEADRRYPNVKLNHDPTK